MAYLPGFDCDIFISYAHANNDDGWVTHLHNELQSALDGFMEGVTIWRDENKLNSNTRFDPEIEKQIKGAAIFLALVSGRYLDSDYCGKELRLFHYKSQNEKWGLSVDNQSRLFNLLLYDTDYRDWPPELEGITGLKFHDDSGWPSDQKEKDFEFQLRKLTREIVWLLKAFKKTITALTIQRSHERKDVLRSPENGNHDSDNQDIFTVFLAASSDSLEIQQERVLNELRRNGVRVVTDVPPPVGIKEHDEKVRSELGRAALSVHLLTDSPGQNIFDMTETDDSGRPLRKSYSRRQVELGLEGARNQLIWLPPDLQIEAVENERHRRFLAELESGDHPPTCRIVREPKSEIARVILDVVETIKQEASAPMPTSAALLNFHIKDRREAWKLVEFLDKRGVLPITEPEMDDPKQTLRILEERIKQVNRLIFVYGAVERSWVKERLWELLKMASSHNCLPKACGVYFVPPRKKATDGNFSLPITIPICEFDDVDIANPQSLKSLLEIA
jgi:hypothetical protein